jgi:hypothetical protein
VPEAVVVALVERLAGLLRELRLDAGLLERAAGDRMKLLAGHARTDRRIDAVERRTTETMVLDKLLRRLAQAERPRHVGEAARADVLREQVADDRLTGPDRSMSGLVPDRRLCTMRDD